MSAKERREEPFELLKRIDLDWTGKEELFIQLWRLRDVQLALALCGSSIPPSVPNLGNLDIGPIDWWLEWMMEVGSTEAGFWWFPNVLGSLFAEHLDREVQDKFVSEFNRSGSKFRQLLFNCVLPYRTDITTDVFSEDAISFLLADLSRAERVSPLTGHLLGRTATEQFVTERLLPLLPDAKQPLLGNLHEVLRQAGDRHGRRYVID